MTIIATDGRTIAADGLEACDGLITSLTAEKIRGVERVIYAMAGPSPLWEALIAWHCAGAKPDEVPKAARGDAWAFVVIDHAGIRQYCEQYAYADVFEAPWAWGTGWKIALGAMYAGKTAAEAVAIICEKSVHCGGEIQVVDIAEALSIKMLEAAE